MQQISRRGALAIIPTAAVLVTSPAFAARTEPSELDGLIEVHKAAFDRFMKAVDAEQAIDRAEKRQDLVIELTIGGAQTAYTGHGLEQAACDCRNDIAKRYASESSRAIKVLEKISPDLAEQATARLRKAQADDLRRMRRILSQEAERQEANGVAAVMREYHEACDAEEEALNTIFSYRCADATELSHKAKYIKQSLSGCCLREDQVELLLASMTEEDA